MESITLRQLEFALAVEEAGAICAAAKNLRIAQPSVSQQISALEKQVGAQLFYRRPTGSPPTPAGRAFLDEIRGVTGVVQHARLAALASSGQTILNIGVELVVPMQLVTLALKVLRQKRPELTPRVREYDSATSLRQALHDGTIDAAVGSPAGAWKGPQRSLGVDSYDLALPSDHRLRDGGPVEITDLRGESWVETPATARIIRGVLEAADISPVAVSTSSTIESAMNMVAAGVGVTLVPERSRRDEYGCRFAPVAPAITQRISAYTRGRSSGEAEALFVKALSAVDWTGLG